MNRVWTYPTISAGEEVDRLFILDAYAPGFQLGAKERWLGGRTVCNIDWLDKVIT